MEYGLSLNINEAVGEAALKAVLVERLGFDYIWIADLPSERYSPVVAAVIAENTSKVRIGLGLLSPLLHKPEHIANVLMTLTELYGERFELCIGVGDLDQLRRVGVNIPRLKRIPEVLLKAEEKILERLRRRGLEIPVWLGAQGPRVLKLARFFDGVLLNYAKPDFVKWAVERIGLLCGCPSRVGVYAPSYIYVNRDDLLHYALMISSAIVALGAPKRVLMEFGLYDKISEARRRLKMGWSPEEALKYLPEEVLEKFSISMHVNGLANYLKRLEEVGVSHVVFSYPQSFSKNTIEVLAKALRLQAV